MTEPRLPAPGTLGGSQLLMDTLEPYYTAASTSVIDQCTLTNTSNQRVRLMALHLVPVDMEPSEATAILLRVQLQPFETYACDELVGQVLESGGRIWAQADQPGTIILRISGRTGV